MRLLPDIFPDGPVFGIFRQPLQFIRKSGTGMDPVNLTGFCRLDPEQVLQTGNIFKSEQCHPLFFMETADFRNGSFRGPGQRRKDQDIDILSGQSMQ